MMMELLAVLMTGGLATAIAALWRTFRPSKLDTATTEELLQRIGHNAIKDVFDCRKALQKVQHQVEKLEFAEAECEEERREMKERLDRLEVKVEEVNGGVS